MKYRVMFRAIILLLACFSSFAACSKDYIPIGEYRIEWDDYDPKLHGQTVLFHKPMVYAVLEDKHSQLGWEKEFLEIGRVLFAADSSERYLYSTESVREDMEFKVESSFWYRSDWFEQQLDGDIRYLVLVDRNSIRCLTSFATLSLYSNRADLWGLRNKGLLRD